jgi:elongation factor G
VDSKSEANMAKALRRFTREDPTFRAGVDEESSETIIRGMGELHLEVYIERMKREYNAIVEVSPPQVAYRETVSQRAEFAYTHKKQTGGSGQFGRVCGYIEPCEQQFEFVDDVVGGSIPREFISAVEKGFRSMLGKGRLLGFPVVNVRVVINDGASHAVDSSDIAFQEAARGAWREGFDRAKPRLLEPIMRVVVEGPAMIVGSQDDGGLARIEAEVPLAEMFGYSTVLRSSTQGKAEFSMEFSRYLPVPAAMAEELMAKSAKAAAAGKK